MEIIRKKLLRTKEIEEEINHMKNKNKGITLIALVITIIVLLILAGISIATLAGDNGILTKANEAKEETRGASVEEEIILWKAEKQADKLTNGMGESVITPVKTKEELLKKLKEDKLLNQEEYEKLKRGETIKIGSKIISISEAKTLVEAFQEGEIKIGDYVDYTPVEGKSVTVGKEETGYSENQTYMVDPNTTWRVLGLSEDGNNLLLKSGSPITKGANSSEKPYLVLRRGGELYQWC